MSPPVNKSKPISREEETGLRSLEAEIVAAGLPPSKFMPLFRKQLLITPDPERALNNFLRFIASGFTSSILRDFFNNPVLLGIALTLFGHSQYLADILVRSPELLHWLTATTALTDARIREDYIRSALSTIAPFERVETKMDALKRFQRREILRISARDILKEADLQTITRELSWLADCIVSAVLSVGLEDLNRRLAHDFRSTFCVVGLGKLGGSELNFSSDIDLMFVYDEDGDLDFGVERIYSYHEYYCRLAEFIVRRLSEHTDEGHLYRTDMRLRPDGAAGPLAMSRQGYLHYYESRGELWERQMLLKARIVAGEEEIGEKFLNDLRPFVYPKTVLLDPREEILAIKKRIETGVQDKVNVKLSKGGIRDIEFVVQALQMLQSNAGGDWKTSNTLNGIEKLSGRSLLTAKESRQLREGYEFLRQVEHRLQLLHGTQTHELPVNKEELSLLGRRLGFHSTRAFETKLGNVQRQVRKIYESVFYETTGRKRKILSTRRMSRELLKRLIARGGFLEIRRAFETIEEIQKNLLRLSDPAALSKLFGFIRRSGAPDLGLINLRILSFSESLKRTIDQVVDSERMFELMLTICCRSIRLTHQLAHEPLLFETLLGRTEDFFKPGVEWQFLLKNDPVRFRAFNESRTIIRHLTGASKIWQSAREFSAIADIVVRSVVEDLQDQFPEFTRNVCVIALGKYGGEELLIGSDLDLLILTHKPDQTDSINSLEEAAVAFVQAFSPESGQVYAIDLRLRPEGKSAPLTAEFSYYRQYLSTRAELWEKQALLKARVIHSEKSIGEDFEAMRKLVLIRAVQEHEWGGNIFTMKAKMEDERTNEQSRNSDLKIGKGGLVDLEFLIQAAQLKHFAEDNSVGAVNSFDAIDRLSNDGDLTNRELGLLKQNYVFLRRLELSVRLNSESNQFILPDDKIIAQAIAASVGERSVKNLKAKIQSIRNQNRLLMKKVFKAIKS